MLLREVRKGQRKKFSGQVTGKGETVRRVIENSLSIHGRPDPPTDARELLTHPMTLIDRRMLQYRLIGECYVHGMMDGKAVDTQQERRIAVERFYLC